MFTVVDTKRQFNSFLCLVALVSPERDYEIISEGSESEDFWSGLGNQF